MFQLSLCIYIRMWWPNQNRMLFAARAVSPPRQSFSITFSDNLARKCAAFCQMHVGLIECFAPEMFTYYPTFNRSLTLEDDLHRKPSQRPPITLHHSQWQTCSHSASALGLLHTINCPPCPDYRQETHNTRDSKL